MALSSNSMGAPPPPPGMAPAPAPAPVPSEQPPSAPPLPPATVEARPDDGRAHGAHSRRSALLWLLLLAAVAAATCWTVWQGDRAEAVRARFAKGVSAAAGSRLRSGQGAASSPAASERRAPSLRAPIDKALSVSTQLAARLSEMRGMMPRVGGKSTSAPGKKPGDTVAANPSENPVVHDATDPANGRAALSDGAGEPEAGGELNADRAAEASDWPAIMVTAVVEAGPRSLAQVNGEVLKVGEALASGVRLVGVEEGFAKITYRGETRRFATRRRSTPEGGLLDDK